MIRPAYLSDQAINHFIDEALAEDVGEGDHTTLAIASADRVHGARLFIKEDGLLAGVDLARRIFSRYDPRLQIRIYKHDGDGIRSGDIAFEVTGPVRSILTTERLVLNCMQRMSGIATYTRRLCDLIRDTGAQIMDTRKTTPGFRLMEKWAVAIGGGLNHRFALYDMIMLKDNHVDMAGGVAQAIAEAQRYLKRENKHLKIEIETRTLAEVEEAVRTGGMDVIMLDNMKPEEMKAAVALIGGRFKTEASGGITESNLQAIAACGVDFISVGALTHSFKCIDMSLKVSPPAA